MSHEYYMSLALKEAEIAYEQGEIPVGALIVAQNRIIAKAHNQNELLQDVTAHAEVLALTAATHFLGSKYLNDCTLYVTLEPCVMCAGALYWAQLGTLVFGASDLKRGFQRFQTPSTLLHPKTQIITGILDTPCQEILKKFFQNLRN
ncbi:MAG: nucleoside deaminase [Microscillaceae bacterium]|nr:nucleoside deaminase [Microscillaceae bacterium]